MNTIGVGGGEGMRSVITKMSAEHSVDVGGVMMSCDELVSPCVYTRSVCVCTHTCACLDTEDGCSRRLSNAQYTVTGQSAGVKSHARCPEHCGALPFIVFGPGLGGGEPIKMKLSSKI